MALTEEASRSSPMPKRPSCILQPSLSLIVILPPWTRTCQHSKEDSKSFMFNPTADLIDGDVRSLDRSLVWLGLTPLKTGRRWGGCCPRDWA